MEERLKILEMVRVGKVTPEQALELLQVIDQTAESSSVVEKFVDILGAEHKPARRMRFSGGKTTFEIPLSMLKFLYSLFPRSFNFTVNQKQLDSRQLMDMVYNGDKGVIYQDNEVVIELV